MISLLTLPLHSSNAHCRPLASKPGAQGKRWGGWWAQCVPSTSALVINAQQPVRGGRCRGVLFLCGILITHRGAQAINPAAMCLNFPVEATFRRELVTQVSCCGPLTRNTQTSVYLPSPPPCKKSDVTGDVTPNCDITGADFCAVTCSQGGK